MKNHVNDLLLAFILLSIPLIQGIDHFIVETDISKFIIGLFIGLTIVAGIVYTYRISVEVSQKR